MSNNDGSANDVGNVDKFIRKLEGGSSVLIGDDVAQIADVSVGGVVNRAAVPGEAGASEL